MEFMYSQRGRQLLTYLGYKYYRVRQSKDGWKWRCTAKKCLANLFTNQLSSEILGGRMEHNHQVDPKISRQMISNNLKQKVREHIEQRPVNLIKEELSNAPLEHSMSIGAKDLGYIRKNLYRSRMRIKSKKEQSDSGTNETLPDFDGAVVIKDEPGLEENSDDNLENTSSIPVTNKSIKNFREPRFHTQFFDKTEPGNTIVCCPDIVLDDSKDSPHLENDETESGATSENSSSLSHLQNHSLKTLTTWNSFQSLRPSLHMEVSNMDVSQQQNLDSRVSSQATLRSMTSDPIVSFFLSMAYTVKTFPQLEQVNIKRKVFDIVTDAENRLASEFSNSKS